MPETQINSTSSEASQFGNIMNFILTYNEASSVYVHSSQIRDVDVLVLTPEKN